MPVLNNIKHTDSLFQTEAPRYEFQKGPLARELAQKVKDKHKDRTHLAIPKAPVAMEWFEEPNLARSLYEVIQTE